MSTALWHSDDDNLLDKRQLDAPVEPAALALFSIGVLVVGQAFVTAMGRYIFGVEQAYSSRYVTPVEFFWMATLVLILGLILKQQLATRFILAHCALIFFMVAQVSLRDSTLGKSFALRFNNLESAANALRVGVTDRNAYANVFPKSEIVPDARPFLMEHRLSIFSDDRYLRIGRPMNEVAKLSSSDSCVGSFDGVPENGVKDGAKAFGWAWSVKERRVPRQIILVDGKGVVVGLASGGISDPTSRPPYPKLKTQLPDGRDIRNTRTQFQRMPSSMADATHVGCKGASTSIRRRHNPHQPISVGH